MRRFKAWQAVGLAVIFLFGGLGPVLGASLNQQLQQNQNQQQQINGKISKYTDVEADLQQSISQTDAQISDTKNKLVGLGTQLASANNAVSKAQQDLDDAESRLEARIEVLRDRLRGIYEEGQVSYLEILFQSASLSDFVSRMEYLRKILANDQSLLQAIEQEKSVIAQRRASLVKQRDSLAQVKNQVEQQNAVLQQQEADYQSKLKQNQAMLDNLWAELQQSQAEEQQIRDLIRQSQYRSPGGARTGALLWPAPSLHAISSKFGYRYHPILHVNKLHSGIDIPVPVGSQVVAAADGVVIYAGYLGGDGNTLIIDHGGGLETLYAHLSQFLVRVGDKVQAGQTIAHSGGAAGSPGAGYSTGPHLHFETRVNGVPEDPLNYL